MTVLGLGFDLVDLSRVERLLIRKGDRALTRLLTATERAAVSGHPAMAQRLATRLAAKEAVYKALQAFPGARGIGWRDIEVVQTGDGRPGIRLHGLAARVAQGHGPMAIHLSLSHSAKTAGAVAVIETAGA